MLDYLKRFIIAIIMAICVGMLIVGGRMAHAETVSGTEDWMFPAEGIISDVYGSRGGTHKAVDIAARTGTPVFSVDDGVVSKSYISDTYGKVVFVQHTSGFETVYAHLHEIKVTQGDSIKKGQQVGSIGNTGKSTGAHLHFEVHRGDWTYEKENAINPFTIFGQAHKGDYVIASHDPFRTVETATHSKYHVQNGDTLWRIASKFSISVDQLKSRNHLHTNDIYPDQILIIPFS
ncbi:murein DD-endopeptidase MepM/ murein hydrolase activator NlpD [Oikeobacillus pervagus]|uniref:Murein DD-endopeptidase MepM/ murein hydrolase activator NlpD n=1 Tax=Oikeobacillus pervagus TaxID=1325931 RepID=A0AAJ1SXW5_9BACI|nr:peptidoglycan DD-metalloendopeptidase family protein [Oikeobacillus pervagus]MDQ0213732.1 murein DD-endopeptidase MepM/ murein hydrolase activator NlpD [Oikeobacillus pervagus]